MSESEYSTSDSDSEMEEMDEQTESSQKLMDDPKKKCRSGQER